MLLAASAAMAEDLSVEQLAAVERDERAAISRVEAAHGNRPPQELTSEERAEIILQQQEASREVFERHGVDPKEYVMRSARLTPEERALVDAEKRRLDLAEAERLAKEAAQANSQATAPEDVEVQRGISESDPVEVYREEGDPGKVESLAEIAGQPSQEESSAKPAAPERAPRPKNRRRR
jgi:hypothetical protein